MQSLTEWFRPDKSSLNVGKTNFVLFSHKYSSISVPCHVKIKIGNDDIVRTSTVKFLGMHIDSELEWHEPLKFIQNKLSAGCLKKEHFSIGNIFVNPGDTAKSIISLDT